MGFFGMLFWIVVVWLVIRAWRRSQACAVAGPRGYESGWHFGDRYNYRDTGTLGRTRPDRQEYVESLEARLSELEERLDFTERLLAGRGEGTS
jgi:hypothetical protein